MCRNIRIKFLSWAYMCTTQQRDREKVEMVFPHYTCKGNKNSFDLSLFKNADT